LAKKQTTIYFCNGCGYETQKWLGRCPGCGEWNTMAEFKPAPAAKRKTAGGMTRGAVAAEAVKLKSVPAVNEERTITGIGEFDRVLGGGLVDGSVVLLGGDPGIGKSTLLLQAAARLAAYKKVFYASGEESLRQLKMRADRVGVADDLIVTAVTDLEALLEESFKYYLKPWWSTRCSRFTAVSWTVFPAVSARCAK